MEINLEGDTFSQGYQLNGRVTFELTSPGEVTARLVGTTVTTFVCKQAIQGRTKVKDSNILGGRYQTSTHYGERTSTTTDIFLNKSTTLGQNLKAGKYTLPISIILESHLPNSFNWQKDELTGAKTFYELEVSTGEEQETVPFSIIHYSDPYKHEGYSINQSVTSKVTNFCCCDSGSLKVTSALRSTEYGVDEEFDYLVSVDNKSSSPVNGIKTSLQFIVNIQDNKGHFQKEVLNLNQVLTEVLIPAKTTQNNIRVKYSMKVLKDQCSSLPGKVLNTSYFLNTQLLVGGCSCGKDNGPKISQEVEIGRMMPEQLIKQFANQAVDHLQTLVSPKRKTGQMLPPIIISPNKVYVGSKSKSQGMDSKHGMTQPQVPRVQ